jgi:DNA invertase Pin-like site-specific DNA recombinase
VIDMPLLDTRKDKDLTGTLIADIVLQLLSYVAETERTMIRQRQAEGIAAAKARVKTWGKPKRQLEPAFFDALAAWKKGEMTCAQAAESCGMTLSNFRYHVGKR